MLLSELSGRIPDRLLSALSQDISELRPAQEKAVRAGLLEGKSLLVCTPTSSGKTLIAELAAVSSILGRGGKAVYIVPLKALASEKFNDFQRRYGSFIKVALSIGDMDSADPFLSGYDLIITVPEKLDSLIRHYSPWIGMVRVVIVDEIHLLNDADRGPTLEIIITILKRLLKNIQLIGLSATIGNPKELADWLGAGLVVDEWRPVRLRKGVYFQGEVVFDG